MVKTSNLVKASHISRDHVIERNSLINLYSKCGEIVTAYKPFDKMQKRNIVSWDSLMAGYLHHGSEEEVLRLFTNMVKENKLDPNKFILATVISCCSKCGLLDEGQQCHGYAMRSGLMMHQNVNNALVLLYSTWSSVKEAMQVLDSARGSNICTYNSLLSGIFDQGYLREASNVMGMMMCECEIKEWDIIAFVNVFRFCTLVKDLNLCRQIHNAVSKIGVDCDLFVGSATIDMYGKCGEISSMRKVFESLQTKNVVTWTSLLSAYMQIECFEESLKQLSQIDIEDVVPNEYTFVVLLNSCWFICCWIR